MMAEEDELEERDDAGAEDRDPEDLDVAAEEAEGGGGNFKKMLFILIPILLIGIGAGLYFAGVLDPLLGKNKDEAAIMAEDGAHGDDHGKAKKADKKKAKKSKDDGHGDGHGGGEGDSDGFVAMPDLLVNLASSSGQPHFLRLKIKLELYDTSEIAAVEAILPRVIDRFQTFLREMRVEDLRGSAGIYRLRQELLYRVNKAADPIEVKDVLFQEILIQ